MKQLPFGLRSLAVLSSAAARLGRLGLGILLLGGCLSRPPLSKQSFEFPLPPFSQSKTQPTPGARVLEIRQLLVAAPFDSQSFIYRTGTYSYERDPYAEFLVTPAESILPRLRAALLDCGVFREVVSRGGGLQPDTIAEIYVSELYGDFQNRSAPVAVLRLSFTCFDSKPGMQEKVLLQKDYEARVPFQQRTAGALMAGWNTALTRVLGSLTADLKAVKEG